MTAIAIDSELFDIFGREVQLDCHQVITAYCRSPAGKAILAAGKSALPQIAAYLGNKSWAVDDPVEKRVQKAWILLMHNIAIGAGIHERPAKDGDLTTWVEWAAEQNV